MKKKKNNQILFQSESENGGVTSFALDPEDIKAAIKNSKYSNEEVVSLRIEADDGEIKNVPIRMDQLRSIIKMAELSVSIVPKAISEYLIDMTAVYARGHKLKLVGRDHELEKVWFYLSQKKRNNVFLVGPADVGKTAIAREVIRQIATCECPKEFYETRVLMFEAESIQKVTNKVKFNVLLKAIANFIVKQKQKIILYIDDSFDMLTNAHLSELLYNFITKYNVPMITTSLEERMEEYFLEVDSMSKYLNVVYVEEPELDEIYPMIKNFIKKKEKEYSIKAPENVVQFGIYSSDLSASVSANPGNIVNIFERAFLEAKRKDKEVLDKESILSCYNSDLKTYNQMPQKEKKATAYHETGHYIAITKCKHITNRKIAYVTILPMDWYMGLTSSYFTKTEEETPGREWYVDVISISLAGRIAEMRVTEEYTGGAYGDLEHANELAKSMIMNLGLSDVCRNRYYGYQDLLFLSEKKKEEIDTEIQNIIDEAYKRAEQIIEENEELLKVIAEKLLKEEILTGQQLQEICDKHEKAKKRKTATKRRTTAKRSTSKKK